ncbi:MAG: hypothetical protein QOH92_800 [Chloroflexota bacterium]|nr:hypothetical protein [Chloroflexota bacterium]
MPDPKLNCKTLPVPPDPLLLMTGAVSGLYVLDVADPLHPVQACQLLNVTTGHFVSATKIVFWYSTFIGTADLQTGSLNWARAWVDEPMGVAFSPDGSSWAYREGDASGVRIHLVVGAKDSVVVTRAILGGHGVPPYGPLDQLAFSATGQYLLTYAFFVAAGDPPNFIVFALDGSIAFKSTTAKFGTWDRAGNRLYFLAATKTAGIGGTVMSLDPGAQPVARSPKLSSYFWPSLSPDGRTLVANTYGAQSFPHPWKLDIASRARTLAASATSTHPVFIAPDLIWSNEGIPCSCGPGGTSQPDGRVIAHNLRTGVNSVVLDIASVTPSKSPTGDIVDVWFG